MHSGTPSKESAAVSSVRRVACSWDEPCSSDSARTTGTLWHWRASANMSSAHSDKRNCKPPLEVCRVHSCTSCSSPSPCGSPLGPVWPYGATAMAPRPPGCRSRCLSTFPRRTRSERTRSVLCPLPVCPLMSPPCMIWRGFQAFESRKFGLRSVPWGTAVSI